MRALRVDRLCAAGALLWTTGCADPGATVPAGSVVPQDWEGSTGYGFYVIGSEPNPRTGNGAAFIRAVRKEPPDFAALAQAVRADHYRGKRVRWSAWVRHENVETAGVWLRVDGSTSTLAFDDMSTRPIAGSSDWHQVSVVLDVDNAAVVMRFGLSLAGEGHISVDDMALEIVGNDVAETNLLTEPLGGIDSVQTDNAYIRARRGPVNLDFEGVGDFDPATVEWLRNNSVSLTTTDPTAALDDLAPIGEMIADARVVGLGEGTHGTREFFRMKHRILRYLVEQKGFTHFAIEASWPEAERINNYVLTGEGTPATLIRGMYFWTWDTYEVLDLVNWMRQWNTTAPADKRVRFQGFDMQSPGMAIDTLTAFVARVSASNSSFVGQQIACIGRYRNDLSSWPRNPAGYTAQTLEYKRACSDSLAQVRHLFTDNKAAWEQAASEEEFARALQSLRAVQQFEEMKALLTGSSTSVRDKAMAENVNWLLSRAGPNARMVLWAHNFHVGRTPIAMGKHLADTHGAQYRNLGFLFGTGTLTAVGVGGAPTTATLILRFSMEANFLGAGHPIALLDTRTLLDANAPPLLREARMRSIGAVFNGADQSAPYVLHRFPEDHDLLIWIAQAEASRRLP